MVATDLVNKARKAESRPTLLLAEWIAAFVRDCERHQGRLNTVQGSTKSIDTPVTPGAGGSAIATADAGASAGAGDSAGASGGDAASSAVPASARADAAASAGGTDVDAGAASGGTPDAAAVEKPTATAGSARVGEPRPSDDIDVGQPDTAPALGSTASLGASAGDGVVTGSADGVVATSFRGATPPATQQNPHVSTDVSAEPAASPAAQPELPTEQQREGSARAVCDDSMPPHAEAPQDSTAQDVAEGGAPGETANESTPAEGVSIAATATAAGADDGALRAASSRRELAASSDTHADAPGSGADASRLEEPVASPQPTGDVAEAPAMAAPTSSDATTAAGSAQAANNAGEPSSVSTPLGPQDVATVAAPAPGSQRPMPAATVAEDEGKAPVPAVEDVESVDETTEALKSITQEELDGLRAHRKPPKAVISVMGAVRCV